MQRGKVSVRTAIPARILAVGRVDVRFAIIEDVICKIVLLVKVHLGEERDDDGNEAVVLVVAHRSHMGRLSPRWVCPEAPSAEILEADLVLLHR